MCVGFPRSPQSRTGVRSWGFAASPPSCNSNYLGCKKQGRGKRLLFIAAGQFPFCSRSHIIRPRFAHRESRRVHVLPLRS
ncbi:hypothetical protein AM349_01135 [Citrobacter freundii]|nr:hypothetical protein AM349_01135 [Citrobacter freundii]POU22013.1 hypothetical protein C3391_10025 [Citrobacter freundii complex sp. CFNIH8]PSF23454.1 hypothetical protein C6985_05050 [Escherichia coli]QAR65943.1 hypothetical protein C3B53_15710 [Citrobacter sp. SL156]QBI29859.1 hypothetical protein WN16_12180 [Citrobacter sp. ABFQG]